MFEFIILVRNFYESIFYTFDTVKFNIGTFSNVSLNELIFGFLGIGLIISVFWRGAKT